MLSERVGVFAVIGVNTGGCVWCVQAGMTRIDDACSLFMPAEDAPP